MPRTWRDKVVAATCGSLGANRTREIEESWLVRGRLAGGPGIGPAEAVDLDIEAAPCPWPGWFDKAVRCRRFRFGSKVAHPPH